MIYRTGNSPRCPRRSPSSPTSGTLRLGGNQLTALPPEIAELTNLGTLRLGGNQLTALPPEIGQLTILLELELELGGNRLTALPPEIGQLTNLKGLGRTGGRPTVMDADKLAAARARRARGESPAKIAKALGVSRASIYRHLATESE